MELETTRSKQDHLNYVFNTLPVTNEIDLMSKKKYRKESILRWKTKRCKKNIQCVSKETNPMFAANDSSELPGSSNQSIFTLNKTTGPQTNVISQHYSLKLDLNSSKY